MFIVVFRFHSGDTPNYVGPFENYKAAVYFRDLWRPRFAEKGEIEVVRVETPKTPDDCRLPAYAK